MQLTFDFPNRLIVCSTPKAETMIHQEMQSNNDSPQEENNESESNQQLHSTLSPLPLALSQNFFPSSAPPSRSADDIVATQNPFHSPICNPGSSTTAVGNNSSVELSSRFDSQSQPHGFSRDMNAHYNFAQNEGLPGNFSQPLHNVGSMSHATGQVNDAFGSNMIHQRLHENDGAASSGLFGFPNRNIMDIHSMNQMNQSRLTANSASGGFPDYQSTISDYQQFFGTGNGPRNPTLASSNHNFLSTGLPLPNSQGSNSSMPSGLLSQQGSLGSQLGNLPIQHTLDFNNPLSLGSSQEALLNSMHLQNTASNSWHHLQQPRTLPQDQSDATLVARPVQMPPEIKWKGRGRSSTFPLKLHQMLLDLDNQSGGAAIASFLPHGRSFQIHQPKEFCK